MRIIRKKKVLSIQFYRHYINQKENIMEKLIGIIAALVVLMLIMRAC